MSVPVDFSNPHRISSILEDLPLLNQGAEPEAVAHEMDILEQLEHYLQELNELRDQLNPGGEFDLILQGLVADHDENEENAVEEPALNSALQNEAQEQIIETPPSTPRPLERHNLFTVNARQPAPSNLTESRHKRSKSF